MAVQSANVAVKSRSELGSRANKRLRDAGLVPGVIYGHKEAVVPDHASEEGADRTISTTAHTSSTWRSTAGARRCWSRKCSSTTWAWR